MANKTTTVIAEAISRVLGPPVWISLAGFALWQHYSLDLVSLVIVSLPVVVPVGLYILLYVFVWRKIDYEFTNVKTRRPILLIAMLGLSISILLSINTLPVITPILIRLLIVLVVTTAITFYWKISFHTTFYTISVLLISSMIGTAFLAFLVLLPPLFWSRIYLKKHEFAQLVLGSIVSLLVII
ncbi:MAG: hypothetical protein ACE5DX_02190 [Candidatus Dojkabacteria bacterium]